MKGKVIATKEQLIHWCLSEQLVVGGIYTFKVSPDDSDYLIYGKHSYHLPVEFVELLPC